MPIEDVGKELQARVEQSDMGGDDIQKKLQLALVKLPDKQRLVFNMKYFEDMSYEQIAVVTDTSVGALKASFHHAVKKIEEYFATHD